MSRGLNSVRAASFALIWLFGNACDAAAAKDPGAAAGLTTPLPGVPGAFEVDVGYSPFDDRRTGEPSLAVNPTDLNNIVIGLTAITQTTRNPERTLAMIT